MGADVALVETVRGPDRDRRGPGPGDRATAGHLAGRRASACRPLACRPSAGRRAVHPRVRSDPRDPSGGLSTRPMDHLASVAAAPVAAHRCENRILAAAAGLRRAPRVDAHPASRDCPGRDRHPAVAAPVHLVCRSRLLDRTRAVSAGERRAMGHVDTSRRDQFEDQTPGVAGHSSSVDRGPDPVPAGARRPCFLAADCALAVGLDAGLRPHSRPASTRRRQR